MSKSYHAFISYRHTPQDMRIAEDVQKQLEHLKIPKEIRDKTGINRIEPIFRDKSELSVTDSLTDEICDALKNSRHLIIICSPEAMESEWVSREISLFLETHKPEDIFTVLSKGEPQDVIPKILLTRETTHIQQDGKKVIVQEPVEPLSCDYRLPISKARKTEIPRLAAALLGCKYDELMRRTEQYRMRRLWMTIAAISIASLSMISYLLWSNSVISENYKQALINESKYLAEASSKALERNDRIEAIRLALQALPDESNNRPITSEAEYAIAKATGVYDLPGMMSFTVQKLYKTDRNITDFLIDPNSEYLAALDDNNTIWVWDLYNDKLIWTKKADILCTLHEGDDEYFCIAEKNKITSYSWKDGTIIWENRSPSDSGCFSNSPFTGQTIVWDSNSFSVIDRNGVTEYHFSTPKYNDLQLTKAVIEPQGNSAIIVFSTNDSPSKAMVGRLDFQSRELTMIEQEYSIINEVLFANDGKIILIDTENDVINLSEYLLHNTFIYSDTNVNIRAFDSELQKELWKQSLSYSVYGRLLFNLPDNSEERLLCTMANTQAIIDLKNGRLIERAEWMSPVSSVIDFNGEESFSILNDGNVCSITNGEHASRFESQLLTGNIYAVKSYSIPGKEDYGLMVLPENKPYLIKYSSKKAGINTVFKDSDLSLYSNTAVMNDNMIVVNNRTDEQSAYLSLYNIKSEEEVLRLDLDPYADFSQFGFTEDNKSLYVIDRNISDRNDLSVCVRRIDTETLTETRTDLPKTNMFPGGFVFERKDNKLYYFSLEADLFESSEPYHLFYGIYDIDRDLDTREEILRSVSIWSIWNTAVSDNGKYAAVVRNISESDLYEVCLFDLKKKKHEPLPVLRSGYRGVQCVFSSDGNRFAVIDEHQISVFDTSGNLLHSFQQKKGEFYSAAFYQDDLYTVNSYGDLIRYSKEYKEIKTYRIEVNRRIDPLIHKTEWSFNENILYLNVNGSFNILNLDQESPRLIISDYLGTDSSGTVLIRENLYKLAISRLYSTEELRQLGKDILSEQE